MFYPELDEKESVGWPLVKQLFQAPFLLWELVIDLPDVHRLQIGVAVARIGLADMHKQVLVELEKQKCISGNERIQKWQMFHLLNAELCWLLSDICYKKPAATFDRLHCDIPSPVSRVPPFFLSTCNIPDHLMCCVYSLRPSHDLFLVAVTLG